MADLSSLPSDLLSQIMLKLDTPEDCIYFSLVCRSFNLAFSTIKHKWYSQIPWLLLPENSKNIFSLRQKRCFQVELSQTLWSKCWGSNCGWIVGISLVGQLYLLNPLTQTQIPLPPLSTMPTKAIVLELAPGDFLVLAIHGFEGRKELSFARPGDKKWTLVLNRKKNGGLVDVCCRDGRKICVLYSDANLGYFDISGVYKCKPLSVINLPNVRSPILNHQGYVSSYSNLYLVASFDELFMAIRYKDTASDGFACTTDFRVYRLKSRRTEWELLNNLGDVALFLGDNHSMSFRATVTGNVKCNCIYFTDHESIEWADQSSELDMGVFNMETKKTEKFYHGDVVYSAFGSPLWFWPKL